MEPNNGYIVTISRVMLCARSRATNPQRIREILSGLDERWILIATLVAGIGNAAEHDCEIQNDVHWIRQLAGL